jgi:hypothetical protein
MDSVRESTQEKKTSGRRRAVGAIAVLLGIVVALTLVLGDWGSGTADESGSGITIGKIAKSELGSGESASAIFDLAPGNYVLICNLWGHYENGMYAAFEVTGEAGSPVAAVHVELGEWFVDVGSASVTAGPITFA